MLILVHPLRIAFALAPKGGSTSIFSWLHERLFGRRYVPRGGRSIHDWFPKQNTPLVSGMALDGATVPEGYFSFCVTRDPVQRVLSAYGNRVRFHKELSLEKIGWEPLLEGHLAEPSLEHFMDRFAEYRARFPTIRHHTAPLVSFLGAAPQLYRRVFDVSEIPLLREALLEHWQKAGVQIHGDPVPEIPRQQAGGPKIPVGRLSRWHLDVLFDFYKDDYATFATISKARTLERWAREQTAAESAEPWKTIALRLRKLPAKNVAAVKLFVEGQELEAPGGELSALQGTILFAPGLGPPERMIFKDARGTGLCEWPLPSPRLGEAHPDHPAAANARFRIETLRVRAQRPAVIAAVAADGTTTPVFRIEAR